MFISIRPDIENEKKKKGNKVVQAASPSAHLSLSHLKQISDERGEKCLMVVQHNAFLPPFYFTLNSLIKQQPLLWILKDTIMAGGVVGLLNGFLASDPSGNFQWL